MPIDNNNVEVGIRYLDVEDLAFLNKCIINDTTPQEQSGVMDAGKLAGAQKRPSTFRYYEQTEDLFVLAAVLFDAVANAHAFYNANKRTAFAACRVFLRQNGAVFDPPLEEAEEIAVGLVVRRYNVWEVANWIDGHASPADPDELIDPSALYKQAVSALPRG